MKKYDFEILIEAYQAHPTLKGWDKGHIARYDGDLYFVFDPDQKNDINDCEYWTLDVEKKFAIYDIDTEFYRYYHTDRILSPINFEELIKE